MHPEAPTSVRSDKTRSPAQHSTALHSPALTQRARRDPGAGAGGGAAGRPSRWCRGSWHSLLAHRTTAPDPPGAVVGGASTWVRSTAGRRREPGHLTGASPSRSVPPWLRLHNAATHPANTYAARQGTSTLQ